MLGENATVGGEEGKFPSDGVGFFSAGPIGAGEAEIEDVVAGGGGGGAEGEHLGFGGIRPDDVQFEFCGGDGGGEVKAEEEIVAGAGVGLGAEQGAATGRFGAAEEFGDAVKRVGLAPAGPEVDEGGIGSAPGGRERREREHKTRERHEKGAAGAEHGGRRV